MLKQFFSGLLLLIALLGTSSSITYAQSALGDGFTQAESGNFGYEKTFTFRGSAANLERKLTAWATERLEPAEGGNFRDGMLCFLILSESPGGNEFVSFNAMMTFDNNSVTLRARDFVYQSMSEQTGNMDVPLQLMPESAKARVFPLLDARWKALMREMERAARR